MSLENLFTTKFVSIEEINKLSASYNEPNWLLERRITAFEEYNKLPLDKDSLFYKYTTFRNFNPENLTPNWTLDVDIKGNRPSINEELTPDIIESDKGIVSNLDEELKSKGIFYDSLHKLIMKDEELAKRIVDKVTSQSENFDKLGSLARAFATNITVLFVPKGVTLDKTLIKLSTTSGEKNAAFSELIALFEGDTNCSYVEILENSNAQAKEDHLFLSLHSIHLEENANIKGSLIQNFSSNTVHVLARNVKLNSYSSFHMISHLQGSQMGRYNSNIDLYGQGSECYDLFVEFGNNNQRFDVKSELVHSGRDTIGQTHARTVMMGKSESVLRGLITIPESGINADSWLSSKGMVMDKGKINAIPSLNIMQNDVKAAHAASVEPLNDEILFYLESRGITKEHSKELLVKGYFEPVLQKLNENFSVDLSRKYLTKKWDSSR